MTAGATGHDHQPFGLGPRRRRLLLAAGLAMAALGAVAPFFPAATSLAVGATAGWLLWFAGALTLGFAILLSSSRLYLSGILAGLIMTGAGMLLTFWPTLGAMATAILVTAVFIVDGSFQVALALKLRPVAAWRWVLASAVASLLAAVLMATRLPERSTLGLGLLLALAFLTTGLGLIVLALARQTTPR